MRFACSRPYLLPDFFEDLAFALGYPYKGLSFGNPAILKEA
jgi:hypothetical protein